MKNAIHTLTTRCLLPALAVALLAVPVQGGSRDRHRYRIPLAVNNPGGPLRAAQGLNGLPAELIVHSTPKIEAQRQELLAWHYRNAARLASDFARKEKTRVWRTGLPRRLEVFLDPSGVAKATGQPRYVGRGQAVARIDLRRGVIYLGRRQPRDLYTELGKWFFYEPGYQWGRKHLQDLKRMRLAERFARFCLNKKRWTEAGGSAKSLW